MRSGQACRPESPVRCDWRAGRALPWALAAALWAGPVSAQEYGWGYNSYGAPGLIDMPAAHSRPDAELALALSHFRNQTRYGLTFQISDRLSASFRYAMLYDIRPQPGDAARRADGLRV